MDTPTLWSPLDSSLHDDRAEPRALMVEWIRAVEWWEQTLTWMLSDRLDKRGIFDVSYVSLLLSLDGLSILVIKAHLGLPW